MRFGHSRTAEAAAGLRAIHRLLDRPQVFDDPYAIELTSRSMRAVCRRPALLHSLRLDPSGLAGAARGHVVGRARFAEDLLAAAVAAGIEQYVIVGAGLDSFSLRRPPEFARLRVFEMDHPATQAAKRERMQRLGQPPRPVHYVPIDFERSAPGPVLAAHPEFHSTQPAFFSWMGTTPYLSREAIFGTLQSLAEEAAPGSEMALDFAIAHRGVSGHRPALQGLMLLAYTRLLGEPLIDHGLSREAFLRACAATGWHSRQALDAEAVRARYFAASRPALGSLPGTVFAHLTVSEIPA